MTTDRKDYYVRLIERLGLATVILFFVGIGVVRVAEWAGPRADKILDKHVETIDTLTDVSKQNSNTLEKMSEAQETQSEILQDIHRVIVPSRVGAVEKNK